MAGLAFTIVTASATPFFDIIAAMGEGDWAKVNTNHYSDVWTPPPQRPTLNDPGSIVRAWSSFAWDSNRDQIILWGGGHNNYGGNEVYTWQSSTLQWSRASLPSAIQPLPAISNGFETVDGALHSPISSHTYDNQEYLPISDRFITFGGASHNNGGPFIRQDSSGVWRFTGPYLWDPSKADPNKVGGLTGSQVNPAAYPAVVGGEMWDDRDRGLPTDFFPKNGATDAVVEGGRDVVYVNGVAGNGTIAGLYKYTVNDIGNPAADTWQQVGAGTNGAIGANSGSGALDVDRNLFVRSNGLGFIYWDLNESGLAAPHPFTPTIVGSGFAGIGGSGLEWDPERGWFDLWMGNGDVWYLAPPDVLSPTGWTLTKGPDPSGPTPLITDASFFTGVLGKWDYVDDFDVFIGFVDDVEGDVWVYKPTDWRGSRVVASAEPGSAFLALGGVGLLMALRFRRQRGRMAPSFP